MSEYGKLNGVPIDPGEGWELVPWEDVFTRGVEVKWGSEWVDFAVKFGCCNSPKEHSEKHPQSKVLAFRRPKTVQAESLKPSCTLPELSAELTRLRTLTAAQSAALEKAEAALKDFYGAYESMPGCSLIALSRDRFIRHKDALTLIHQAKEVGSES